MIIDTEEAPAQAVVRAMFTVANAKRHRTALCDGSARCADRVGVGVRAAQAVPVDDLAAIAPDELAAAIGDPQLRVETVRLITVMAFVDAIIDDAKLQLVLDFAAALTVEQDFVAELRHLIANDVRWTGFDMLRHNVESIPGLVWDGADPIGAFLPYRDSSATLPWQSATRHCNTSRPARSATPSTTTTATTTSCSRARNGRRLRRGPRRLPPAPCPGTRPA